MVQERIFKKLFKCWNQMLPILILLFIFLFICTGNCFAENTPEKSHTADSGAIMEEQLDYYDFSDINAFVQKAEQETGITERLDIKTFIRELIKGDGKGRLKQLGHLTFRLLAGEVVDNVGLLMKLVILSVLCAILQNINSSFQQEEVSHFAYYICYMAIMVMLVNCFHSAMNIGYDVIDQMTSFMNALLPNVFIALLSVTNNTGYALMQPVLFALITGVSNAMDKLVLPLIYVTAVLSIINHISDKIQISKLRDFTKQVAFGVIGIVTTLFIGIVSIQKIFITTFNGVAAQTAKFALGSFVPVIGDFLSNAYDLVVSCSMMIKSGIGIFGLFVLILIAVLPLIKLLTLFFVFKLTAALIQPMMDNQVASSLSDLSGSLFMLFIAVLCVILMFFIGITVLMTTGGLIAR